MPTDLGSIITALQTSANPAAAELEQLLKDMGSSLMEAQKKEQSAFGELTEARNAPDPQVNPLAQTIVRSMGLASEAFTGKQGAAEESRNLIAGKQKELTDRRLRGLQELEQAYERAAQRADQMGDRKTQLEMLTKRDKAQREGQSLLDNQREMLHDMLATIRQGKQIESNERIAQWENTNRANIARMSMTSSMSIDATKLPADLAAAISPMNERMKQLSQARGSLLGDSKIKGGDLDKRLKKIDEEYMQVSEEYTQTLLNYFQQPAGNSGEAAKTPLGTIMDRARKAGAQTFEDFRTLVYGNSASALLKGYDIKKALTTAKVDIPGAGFPTRAAVKTKITRYKELTQGPLAFAKISQHKDEVNQLAEWLTARGFPATSADDLLRPPSGEPSAVQGIEVSAKRK